MIQQDIRDLILAARQTDRVARPFPSGVSAGDNRGDFLNASEAGKCTRWLWYEKHRVAGETHNPHGIFDRGHAFEHWAVTYLSAGLSESGGQLLFAGEAQTRLMLPDYRLAGTPDGLLLWDAETSSVLEVKSHGTSASYDMAPSTMHVRQVEMNIELFCELTDYQPEDGFILYGLAENWGRMALHHVERRPAMLMEMIGKANQVFDSTRAEDVMPDGVMTRQCVICPFRSQCSAAIGKEITGLDRNGLDDTELAAIDRLVAARQRAAAAQEECSMALIETEAEIARILSEAGASKVKRNGYLVTIQKDPADAQAALSIEIRPA